MRRRTTNPGHLLARLWRTIINRRRPVAGHDITILRGSPIKGSGDYDRSTR